MVNSDPRTTAGRRRRALAHLAPVFDLHLYRSRNPSAVPWEDYDFIGLIQQTIDVVAMSSGLDGNLGVPRDTVLAEMAATAAAMAPNRPREEHQHVAAHVLDHLVRHGESSSYFTVEFADPDARWIVDNQQVRLLYERITYDGVVDVHADTAAVSLLIIATNRTLEDEHEAVIAVMQAQAASGRLDAAIGSAEDALTLSRAYAANVRRMLIEAERDVTRVDYLDTLRPELTKASKHLQRRVTVDGTLLRHLEDLRTKASEDNDPQAARQLAVACGSLDAAISTLASLQTDVSGAAPRWRDAQAAQAFSTAPVSEIDPTRDVLSAVLCDADLPPGCELSPPIPGLLLDFTALVDRLTAPSRAKCEAEGAPVIDELLADDEGVYAQFPEQYHVASEDIRLRRIPAGGKVRLSELLGSVDELFAGDEEDAEAFTAPLVALASSRATARRRLRLLLALDALMLWRPDRDGGDVDGPWWAEDDETRADLDDLQIPDMLVHSADSSRQDAPQESRRTTTDPMEPR